MTWANLLTFTHELALVRLDGIRVMIPNQVPKAMVFYPDLKEQTTAREVVADGAELTARSYQVQLPRLRVANTGPHRVLRYDVTALLPESKSTVHSRGELGPFEIREVKDLAVSGVFDMKGALPGFGGVLSSEGRMRGVLSKLLIDGNAAVRGFQIEGAHRTTDLLVRYATAADCMRGDVTIEKAEAAFLGTRIEASGSVAEGNKGKTLRLSIRSQQARLEDLLGFVVGDAEPPASGGLQFDSQVEVPWSSEPFLKRLRWDGSFVIRGAEFRKAETQRKMDVLSARARSRSEKQGSDKANMPDVRASVHASFRSRNGVAHLSAVQFALPSVVARANGSFSLLSKQIDLRGQAAMHASLSGAAGGWKSVFLIPLDPLYKKEGAGAVIPIQVSGTYSHPVFRASLKRKKT